MDVEGEIRDLKRRVGELEGGFGFLTQQVRASALSSLVLISATSSISASPTASSLWAFACCFWELSCILSALARCALAESEQSSALSIMASSDFLIGDLVIVGTVQCAIEG